jgi:hypothetical protein
MGSLQVVRHEQCQITLHGFSEFEARNVVLSGSQNFEVIGSPVLMLLSMCPVTPLHHLQTLFTAGTMTWLTGGGTMLMANRVHRVERLDNDPFV